MIYVKNLKIYLLVFSIIFVQSALGKSNDDNILNNSIRDVQIVVGAAAGGAILGLSTLPFVEVPERHLQRIVIGAALGIILGVGVVAWQQGAKSKNMYLQNAGSGAYINFSKFSTSDRLAWHNKSFIKNLSVKNYALLDYSFSF